MQAASFIGVLNTILVIMLIYYGLKFVGRFLIPILFQKVVKNAEEKFKQQQGNQNYNNTKEGEITIDKKPNGQNKSNNDVVWVRSKLQECYLGPKINTIHI